MKVLMFHRVLPQSLINEMDAYYLRGTLVSTEFLESEIEKYLQQGFVFKTVIDSLNNTSEKTIVLTFDDGYDDNYKYVFPILNKFRIRATFYPTIGYCISQTIAPLDYYYHYVNQNIIPLEKENWITGNQKQAFLKLKIADQYIFIDDLFKNKLPKVELKYMTGLNLQELQRAGNEIGGHSFSHEIYTRLNSDELKTDYNKMKEAFDIIAIKLETFAYTDGRYNNSIIDFLSNEGIRGACAIKKNEVLYNSSFEIEREFSNSN